MRGVRDFQKVDLFHQKCDFHIKSGLDYFGVQFSIFLAKSGPFVGFGEVRRTPLATGLYVLYIMSDHVP